MTVLAAGAWFEQFGMAHFPAWTAFTLAAVVISTWLLPDLKEEDIGGSGFAITGYNVSEQLGGDIALSRLRKRLKDRGIKDPAAAEGQRFYRVVIP